MIRKGALMYYSGSSSCGSSGGAIIINGKLAGINLGSFYDYDEAGSKRQDPSKLISFDMVHPKENIMLRDKKVEKNFNLGISVQHIGIGRMFKPAFTFTVPNPLIPDKKTAKDEVAARGVFSGNK